MSSLSEVLFSLRRNVQILLSSSFLLLEDDTRVFALLLHFTPSKLLNVTFAESCKAREKERTFQTWIVAWSGDQCLDFFQGEVVTLYISSLEAFDATERIDGNYTFLERLIDTSTQFVEVGHLGVLGQSLEGAALCMACAFVSVFLHCVQEVLESFHELRRYITESSLLVAIYFKIPKTTAPITPVPF